MKTSVMYPLIVKDSNGNILQDGETVSAIKNLKVRGSTTTTKQGTTTKKIRLLDDPEEMKCKIDEVHIVLKTIFLKKK